MKSKLTTICAFACAVALSVEAQAQSVSSIKVTPDTFIRAETDGRFACIIKRVGGINRPSVFRVPTPLDDY